jgi:D-serine deaminase-like pyridoxal phosphate-dependent protein
MPSLEETLNEMEQGTRVIAPHVDLGRALANIARFHVRAAERALPVRAHVKGHRTVELALEQMRAGACGIAVTRVAGTAAYIQAGIRDVVVAWPWREPALLGEFVAFAAQCRLSVHVDRPETVASLDRLAAARGARVGVRIQVGDGRQAVADVPWPWIEAIADEIVEARHLTLDGITHYRAITTPAEALHRTALASRAARDLAALADRLRCNGFSAEVVALGGTTTIDADLEGVTEIGAGAYALGDAGLARMGICDLDDVAVSVPASAAHLLDGCERPWCTAPGLRLGDRLIPTHVCQLVLNATVLDCSTGERWAVIAK